MEVRRLSNDISRCAGRMSFDSGKASICPDRATCRRYTDMAADVAKRPNARMVRYSVAMNLRDEDGVCRMRIAA